MPSRNAHRAKTIRGIAFAALGGCFWAFSGTCAQLITVNFGVPVSWLTSVRLPFAALLFLIICLVREPKQLGRAVRSGRTWGSLLIFGLFGILLTQYAYLSAISYTNAGTGTVMERMGLVLLTIIVCIQMRRLPHRRELIGIVLALAGVVLIATKGNLGSLEIPPEALVWGLLLACGFVGYTLFPVKLLERWGSFIPTALGMAVAGIACNLLVRPWEIEVNLTPALIAAVAAIVVFGTILAYAFYLQGVKEAGPMRAGLVGCLEPVAATLISAVWLHTPVTWADIAGMVLILVMVVLVTLPAPTSKAKTLAEKES